MRRRLPERRRRRRGRPGKAEPAATWRGTRIAAGPSSPTRVDARGWERRRCSRAARRSARRWRPERRPASTENRQHRGASCRRRSAGRRGATSRWSGSQGELQREDGESHSDTGAETCAEGELLALEAVDRHAREDARTDAGAYRVQQAEQQQAADTDRLPAGERLGERDGGTLQVAGEGDDEVGDGVRPQLGKRSREQVTRDQPTTDGCGGCLFPWTATRVWSCRWRGYATAVRARSRPARACASTCARARPTARPVPRRRRRAESGARSARGARGARPTVGT